MTAPADAAPADRGADATFFSFEHKVFSVPGTIFRMDRSTGRVSMHMLLGGSYASLTIKQLVHSFNIAPGSPDEVMLKTVEAALHHVREIRPGDSIPNEILDGTASWSLDARHLELARNRLLIQLAAWVTEGNSAIDANADVMALIERPETKEKVNAAFTKAAEQLGLGVDGKHQITTMIEQLAGELAYIEALREKLRAYIAIRSKAQKLRHVYRRERLIGESVERVIKLISPPLDKIIDLFAMVDAHTAEVISSLKQLSGTIEFVRETRDQLREFVLLWEDLDKEWAEMRIEQAPATEELIKQTYRFAATHYLSSQRWV
jgi:hypothetical protein